MRDDGTDDDDTWQLLLTTIGLPAPAHVDYFALRDNPEHTLSAESRRTLVQYGLIWPATGQPVPVRLAVEAFATRSRIAAEQADLLAETLAEREVTPPGSFIEVVQGREAVSHAFGALQRAAVHSIDGFDRPPYLTSKRTVAEAQPETAPVGSPTAWCICRRCCRTTGFGPTSPRQPSSARNAGCITTCRCEW